MYLCIEKNFVKPVVKDFCIGKKSIREFVFDFDLRKRVPPTKPHGFERGIDMCGCYFLEFFFYHICDEEGGKMMVNLQHRRV